MADPISLRRLKGIVPSTVLGRSLYGAKIYDAKIAVRLLGLSGSHSVNQARNVFKRNPQGVQEINL